MQVDGCQVAESRVRRHSWWTSRRDPLRTAQVNRAEQADGAKVAWTLTGEQLVPGRFERGSGFPSWLRAVTTGDLTHPGRPHAAAVARTHALASVTHSHLTTALPLATSYSIIHSQRRRGERQRSPLPLRHHYLDSQFGPALSFPFPTQRAQLRPQQTLDVTSLLTRLSASHPSPPIYPNSIHTPFQSASRLWLRQAKVRSQSRHAHVRNMTCLPLSFP